MDIGLSVLVGAIYRWLFNAIKHFRPIGGLGYDHVGAAYISGIQHSNGRIRRIGVFCGHPRPRPSGGCVCLGDYPFYGAITVCSYKGAQDK